MLARLGLILLGCLLAWFWLPPGPAPWLVFVGDLPLLALLFFQDGKHWKRWTLLYGFLYTLAAAHWLAYITPAHPLGAAVVTAPVYVMFGGAVRWLAARRVPFAVSVGLAVVLEEMLRTIWMGGFPWPQRCLAFATDASLDLGMAWLVSGAALAGGWLFSFVAGYVGAALFQTLRSGGRAQPAMALRLVGIAALLGGLFAMAVMRESGESLARSEGTARGTKGELVVVQAAIDQSLKTGDPAKTKQMFDEHVRLSATAVRQLGRDRLLGILWPETMIPWPFLDADVAHRFPEAWEDEVGVMRRLRDDAPLAREIPWFVGAIHHFRRGAERHTTLWDYGDHDSLFWVDPSKAPSMGADTPPQAKVGEDAPWVQGRHDKVNLVPGGEYTPGAWLLPPLEWFRKQISKFPALDAGDLEQEPWEVPDRGERPAVKVGSIVCYDVAFPRACRAWRLQGAEVLLNPGNYGWFGPTAFRSQLAAHARLRAAELNVTVVVAGNTGPTAFYDRLGRPYGTFRADGAPEGVPAGGLETTYVPGYAHAPLALHPAGHRLTPYARFGDLPWWVLAALWLAAALIRGRKQDPVVGDSA